MVALLLGTSLAVAVLNPVPPGYTAAGGDSTGAEHRAAPAIDEWPTFKADVERTGESVSGAPSVGKVLWAADYRPAIIYSSPIVWNGTVYIGTASTLRAIWAKNGTERWAYEAANPIHTAPTIKDGVVYFGMSESTRNGCAAVDALTGELLWNASIPDFVTSAPLVVASSVYVGCQDGVLYCLKTSDGKERWNFTAGSRILYGALAYSSGNVVFGVEADDNNEGTVYAVNASTGKEAWNTSVTGSVWSAPAIVGQDVLVPTAADKALGLEVGNGYIYCLDLTTGDFSWRSDNIGRVYASPSVADGRIYVGTFGKTVGELEVIEPRMYCLDLAASGRILWSNVTMHGTQKAKIWSSVAVAGTKILFGDELGYMNAWSILGRPIWSEDIGHGSAVKASPAVALETVFTATTLGDVVAFGAQPDMSVSAATITVEDQYPHLGQRVRVSAKVSNLGDKTATGRVFLYNGSLDDWNSVIGSTTVLLEPGRSTQVEGVWTADELGPRAVWVRVMDVVPNEADLTNNVAKRVLEVQVPAEGWLMQGSDAAGSAFIATERPTNNVTKWLRAVGGTTHGGIAVAQDQVIFPTADRLLAMNRTDGAVIWDVPLGANATSPPAVGGGAAFVGTEAGMLVSVDLEEGFPRFARQLDGAVTAGPVVVGWRVYVGTSNATGKGWLYSLDTLDGSAVWSRAMDAAVRARPAVVGEHIFALSDLGAVLALNATTGLLTWQFPIGTAPEGSLTASPIVSEGRLYVPSSSGIVYCLDADPSDGVDEGHDDVDGSSYDLLWTYQAEQPGGFERSGTIVDGLLALVKGDGEVLTMDAVTGELKWRRSDLGSAPIGTDLVSVNGSIVVGGGSLDILSSVNGTTLWTYDQPLGTFLGSGAAYDGMLFFSDDRIIYAFGKVLNIPPVARILTPQTGIQVRINEVVVFNASSSTDDKTLPEESFGWDLGDGTTLVSRVVSHAYDTPGTYRVVLTVVDTDGAKDNVSVTVHVLQNHEPVLDLAMIGPGVGTSMETPFNFSVRYTDPDGDAPLFIVMRLADEPEYQFITLVEVDPEDTNYTDGKLYYTIKTLGSRPYPAVTFRASDGISEVEVNLTGPRVLTTRRFTNVVGDIELLVTYVGPNNLTFEAVPSPPTSFPTSMFPLGLYTSLILETTYLQEARISINYTVHDTTGLNLSTLSIFRWTLTNGQGEWKYLPSSQVDLERRLIMAEVPSLRGDIYAVLGNRLSAPPNSRPVPIIIFESKTYRPGSRVDFDGSASYDPDEQSRNDRISDYIWDFGDGTPVQHGANASHVYKFEGVYTVKLTVRDNNEEQSLQNETTVKVTVRAQEESTWLLWLALGGILVLIILLFYPKSYYRGGAAGTDAHEEGWDHEEDLVPEKEGGQPPKGDTAPRGVKREGGGKPPNGDLDTLIDELEEDRAAPPPK